MSTPPGPYRQGTNAYHPESVEAYGTDGTYGSTSQLLRLTPQVGRRATPADTLAPLTAGLRGVYIDQGFEEAQVAPADTRRTPIPPPIDAENENKENIRTPSPRPVSTLSVTLRAAATYREGAHRTRGPAINNVLHAHEMLRLSSFYSQDEEDDWESIQLSESRGPRGGFADEQGGEHENLQESRPSQDSYADTSVAGSSHRLSLPLPGIVIPMPPASIRTIWPSGEAASPDSVAARDGTSPSVGSATRDEDGTKGSLHHKAHAVLGLSGVHIPARDAALRVGKQKELQVIGQKTPSAVGKAVEAVRDAIRSLTHVKPGDTTQANTFKMPSFGLGKKTSIGRVSQTRGLLTEPPSPFSNQGLRRSESPNTLQTIGRRPSDFANSPVRPFSLLNPTGIASPTPARLRGADINSTAQCGGYHPSPEALGAESIEMASLSRGRRVSRVAMSSQTELRPLQLADSTAASGFTGRLTDVQLAEAEGGWTMRPDVSRSSPLTRISTRGAGSATLGNQSDDDLPVNQLMRPHDALNISTRRIQKKLTRPYFRVCIACPISAALFGLGGLDWKMRQMTAGRVVEMSPSAKKQALTMFLPLGVVLYAAIGILIGVFIVLAEK